MLPQDLTDDINVSYCDWYMRDFGYVFTSFDNGIGAVLLNHGDFGVNMNMSLNWTTFDWNSTIQSALSILGINKTHPIDVVVAPLEEEVGQVITTETQPLYNIDTYSLPDQCTYD